MTKRIIDLIKGLAASLAIAALVAAVPYLLWRFAGLPGQNVMDTLGDPLSSDETRTQVLLSGALVVIAWLCWAQVAYSLILELIAGARGKAAATAAVLPGVQSFAARLVATATLTLGSFTPTLAAAAVPLSAPAPIVEVAAQSVPVATAAGLDNTASEAPMSWDAYVVAERDTFWSIAETSLGDGLRWQEIRDANLDQRMSDGSTITATTEAVHPGWTLRLPAGSMPAPSEGEADDGDGVEMIDVNDGDHFWAIAEEALAGDWEREPTNAEIAPYWADLVEVNRDRLLPPDDPDLIYPSQQFELPPTPEDPNALPAPVFELPQREPQSEPPTPETTAPTATVAPTTSVSPPSTSQASVPAATDQEAEMVSGSAIDRNALYAAGIGSLGLGAGALALALRRKRAGQLAKRAPTATIEPPTPEASEYEQRLRPIADVEAARWVEATNQLITARLAANPGQRLPAVVAMRAGKFGVEVLLDEACPPPDGFISANDANTAWRLHPDLELRMVEAETADAQPYSPALAVVGTSEAGDLLLDLEQLAAVSLEGDLSLTTGWLRSLATSLTTTSWSEHCEIVAIGLPKDLAESSRVTFPDHVEQWCERTIVQMTQIHGNSRGTAYEQRTKPGEIHHPTIVLIGDDSGGISERLAPVAQLVNTPLAVITTTPLANAERIHLDAEASTLEPVGVAFKPIITDAIEIEVIEELVDKAESPAVDRSEHPTEETVGEAPEDYVLEPVDDVIARINRPRPVEVQLLRSTPTIAGIDPAPTGKPLAVICYLAFHRDVPTQRIRDTFWVGRPRKTADNAISDIRRLLGADESGKPYLGDATNNGNYELSDEIGCDWTRVTQLIDAARNRSATEAATILQAALELVDGQAGGDAPIGIYGWLIDDHDTYSAIGSTIADAAHQLGEHAVSNGDADLATWAAAKGLAAVPGNEAMRRIEMRAAAIAGNTRGIHDAYEAAAQHAAELGTWVEVEPETDILLRDLTKPTKAQAS